MSQRGCCRVCGKDVVVRKDGTVVKHRDQSHPNDPWVCRGSNTPPKPRQANPEAWVAYMADLDGFVVDDPGAWLTAMKRGPLAINTYEAKLGFQVGSVALSRGPAAPKPQYEGSDILREPGSYSTSDRISFEIYDCDYDRAALCWDVVTTMAKTLNERAEDGPQRQQAVATRR